jgi:hypothetical protein
MKPILGKGMIGVTVRVGVFAAQVEEKALRFSGIEHRRPEVGGHPSATNATGRLHPMKKRLVG